MSAGRGDLRSRLGRLRGGVATAVPPAGNGFRERVERLMRLAGPASTPVRSDDGQTARLLGGQVAAPGLIQLQSRVPLTSAHGQVRLQRLVACVGTMPFCELPQSPGGLLFLDTETTGLAGGTGTVAFLVGLAWLEGDRLVVEQWLLTRFGGEPALLGALTRRLALSPQMVSFNGKSFDVPLLAARLRLAGMESPIAQLPHLDLLHPGRRAFAARWSDCRLQTMERRLLGFQRREDLPSAEVPAVWRDFVCRGEASRMPAVLQHNRLDLLSLAALLPALAHVYAVGHPEADAWALARSHLQRGDTAAARAQLERQRDQLDPDGLLQLARLRARCGDWDAAVVLWETLAAAGNANACERLAKYHEHRRRDVGGALVWTRRLLALEPADAAHLRRSQRLLGKLGRPAVAPV